MRTALLPATLLAAALALPCAAPARAEILVTIDKTTQRMSVAVDGENSLRLAGVDGRPGYDTPNGTFHPFRMEADHFSKEWDDAPMPHSVFFTKIGHAIHGSLDTRHLGSAASHGCVRLSPEHASAHYALVEAEGLKDTTVVVAGQTPIATAEAARRRAPVDAAAGEPLGIAPDYGQEAGAYYGRQPAPYGAPQPYDGQSQQSYYGRPQQQPYDAQQPAGVLCVAPALLCAAILPAAAAARVLPPAISALRAAWPRTAATAAASAVLCAPSTPLQLSGRHAARGRTDMRARICLGRSGARGLPGSSSGRV